MVPMNSFYLTVGKKLSSINILIENFNVRQCLYVIGKKKKIKFN
jgi:hypothetical protein